jgi:preprotein translocase subunit SecA
MAHLREGIGLRSYAQTNPLQDYVNEGYDLFRDMNNRIAVDIVFNFLNVKIQRREAPKEDVKTEGAVEAEATTKEGELPAPKGEGGETK